jgi:hypothetical protein
VETSDGTTRVKNSLPSNANALELRLNALRDQTERQRYELTKIICHLDQGTHSQAKCDKSVGTVDPGEIAPPVSRPAALFR